MDGGPKLVEYFYGNKEPTFSQAMSNDQNTPIFHQKLLYMPQFLAGHVKKAPSNIKRAPGDVKLFFYKIII